MPSEVSHGRTYDIEVGHARQMRVISGLGISFEGWARILSEEVKERWNAHADIAAMAADVQQHLMNVTQELWLLEHNLTLPELLQGHFAGFLLPEVEEIFCQRWNDVVGLTLFGFVKRDGKSC